MKNPIIIFSICLSLFSCDLIIKGVQKKAVEAIQEEVEKPEEIVVKNGEYKTYYDNGNIKTLINYLNDVKDGEAITYYENGNVKLALVYQNNIKHGPSSYYYEDGKLYRESNYIEGELEGIQKIYEKGRLTSEVPYKYGQTGKGLKEYFTNGNLKTDFPKLEFEEIDDRKENHTYYIKVKFSESHPKDKFYIGELSEGIYLHDYLYQIYNENGVGKYPLDIPPGATGSQEIKFVGIHYTKLGNSYVTDYTYNLVIR